ncbi:MAG: hypothetical protein QXU76_00010 [Candidatus Bilamarchaeaceae archaeon]
MKRIELEDADVRRNIRAELTKGNIVGVSNSLRIYAKGTMLEGIIKEIVKDPLVNRYSESRCFYNENIKISNLLDVLLLDIYRDNLQSMDTGYKTILAKALASNYVSLSLKDVLKDKSKITDDIIVDDFSGDKISFKVKVSNTALVVCGIVKDDELVVTTPSVVRDSFTEWGIIAVTRIAGFSKVSLNYLPLNIKGKGDYISNNNNKLFVIEVVEGSSGKISISHIHGVKSDDVIYFDSSLGIVNNKIVFNEVEIAGVMESKHDVPLEILYNGVKDD